MLRRQNVTDPIIRHIEFQLPIGREIGHRHEHFAALNRPSKQLVAHIPSKHTPRNWAGDDKLFAFMARNTVSATRFFHVPGNRLVEIGTQIEI